MTMGQGQSVTNLKDDIFGMVVYSLASEINPAVVFENNKEDALPKPTSDDSHQAAAKYYADERVATIDAYVQKHIIDAAKSKQLLSLIYQRLQNRDELATKSSDKAPVSAHGKQNKSKTKPTKSGSHTSTHTSSRASTRAKPSKSRGKTKPSNKKSLREMRKSIRKTNGQKKVRRVRPSLRKTHDEDVTSDRTSTPELTSNHENESEPHYDEDDLDETTNYETTTEDDATDESVDDDPTDDDPTDEDDTDDESVELTDEDDSQRGLEETLAYMKNSNK